MASTRSDDSASGKKGKESPPSPNDHQKVKTGGEEGSETTTCWCRLLSQSPQISNIDICKPAFTFGSSMENDYVMKVRGLRSTLFTIKRTEKKGVAVPLIEIRWIGFVLLNGTIQQDTSHVLNSGDELIVGIKPKYAFIFVDHPAKSGVSTWPLDVRSHIRDEICDTLGVSLNNFPYSLSHNTIKTLIEASYIHLKHKEIAKQTSKLTAFSPWILLSGPAGSETCQEMLAKALANHFSAKLLIFDLRSLSIALASKEAELLKVRSSSPEDQPAVKADPSVSSSRMPKENKLKIGERIRFTTSRYGIPGPEDIQRAPSNGSCGRIVLLFEDNPKAKVGVRLDEPVRDGVDLGGLCVRSHGFFCDATDLSRENPKEDLDLLLINTLPEVIDDESDSSPFILFVKDANKSIAGNRDVYNSFWQILGRVRGNVVAIYSHTNTHDSQEKVLLDRLFPNQVTIHVDDIDLATWRSQLERDAETLKSITNLNHLYTVLAQSMIECEGLETLSMTGLTIEKESAEKIVRSALTNHLMLNPKAGLSARVVLSPQSMKHGIKHFRDIQNESNSLKKSQQNVTKASEQETLLQTNVIAPSDIGVTFDDIGMLDNVKETLKELVMLPLKRPELFCKGVLAKPCTGILLFGPPGTGKTMLAKAVAKEVGATFINISPSRIMDKFVGESEKNVSALFSLAKRLAPSIIFVDEADSLLGQRSQGDQSWERKVKNEFMMNWDGLVTQENERVLMLVATSRPFDLDEAVIRRLPRRLMVNLPDAPNREKILKIILAEENLSPDVNYFQIAKMTDGYSGSDLKNLCVAAAYHPIKEILEKEKRGCVAALAEGKPEPASSKTVHFRPINMDDFRQALKTVGASILPDGINMIQLLEWNERYAQGGSQKKVELYSFYG